MQSNLRIGLSVGFTAVMGAAVTCHLAGINGPWYWKLEWRSLPYLRTLVVTGLCSLPIFAAQIAYAKRRITIHTALALVAMSMLFLQIGFSGINTPTFDLSRIWKIIIDPGSTTYFTDAAKLVQHPHILKSYPELLEGQLTFHSINKPPGPVVFYVSLIRLFGYNQASALIGALIISLCSALSVFAGFFFFRSLGSDDESGLHGASAMVLCTGPIAFFPEFDQAYVLVTCLAVGCWYLALRRNRWIYSCLSGAVFALGLFFAYHLSILVLFLALSSLVWLDRDRSVERIKTVAKHGFIVVTTLSCSYVVLWILYRFDFLATFSSAVSNQEIMKARFIASGARLYPETIIPDLIDFSLGASWIPVAAAPLFMIFLHRQRGGNQVVGIGWACLLQIVFAIISGQIAVETARVLNFLIPFLMFPIAVGLAKWSLNQRLVFLGSMGLLLAINFRNMVFLAVK